MALSTLARGTLGGRTRAPGTLARRTAPYLVLLLVSAACCYLIAFHLSRVNPVDFLVYRYGAGAARGGANIYDGNLAGPMLPAGGLPFTYTPFAALALLPTTLLPWKLAFALWGIASLLVLAWTIERFTPLDVQRRTTVIGGLLALAALTTMLVAGLGFGQINVLLMGLCLADLYRSDTSLLGRYLPRGVLVGVAAAIKLTPILFIVYFVVTRQRRLAAWSAAGLAATFAIGGVVYPAMTHDFFTTVVWSLSGRVDLGGAFATYGNSSVQGALAALAQWNGWGSWSQHAATVASVVVATCCLLGARTTYRRGRIVESWLMVGLTAPLVSPVSWVHHWVYLVPALVMLGFRARSTLARTAVGVGTVMLLFGPKPGQLLLEHGGPLLAPLALLQRECLIVVTVACLCALRLGRPSDRPFPQPRSLLPSGSYTGSDTTTAGTHSPNTSTETSVPGATPEVGR